MKGFDLICPPIAETAVTGFLGGIEKVHRDRTFRVEFHRGGKVVCSKDGKPVAWEVLPHGIRKAAHEGADMLTKASQFRQERCGA